MNEELFSNAESFCREISTALAELSVDMGGVQAPPMMADSESAFRVLWKEFQETRSEVDQTVQLWISQCDRSAMMPDRVFRQFSYRVTGALKLLRDRRWGSAYFSVNADTTSDSLVARLLLHDWQSDTWPAHWLRECAVEQITDQQVYGG